MVRIGVDPHKHTHTAVAVDELGRQRGCETASARRDGFGALMVWGRRLDQARMWVIEDCRHVSGPLERFLLDHGETVVRLAPRWMAGARHSVRERGKSDPIDALAVARIALREGIDSLPAARLVGPELEIRQLVVHRERLVDARTRLINELRWQLHDLWPDWEIPARALDRAVCQQRVHGRLSRADPSVRVRIACDQIRRIKDLTRTINQLTRNRWPSTSSDTIPRRPSTSPNNARAAKPNATPSAHSNAISLGVSTDSSKIPTASQPRSA